jgi:Flp pilus assembly protein TadG
MQRRLSPALSQAHKFDGKGRCVGRPARGHRVLGRLGRDKRGVAAVLTALAATSLLGAAGLAIEVGGWYLLRRNMQAAADAAAMAGAVNLDASGSATTAEAAARSVTTLNGFVNGAGGTTVTVLPDLGTGRVAVTVERLSVSFLLKAAGVSEPGKTVRAGAVARVVEAGAKPCAHAIGGSLSVGNNTDITAESCALISDSASPDAFRVGSGGSVANGSGRITAATIVTHGGCEGCVEALGSKLTLTRSPVPTTYAPKAANPYDALSTWSPPASAVSNQSCQNMPAPPQGGSAVTLQPGCYDSIDVKSNGPVNLGPGVYYIRGGDLNVQGTLTCAACTDDNGISLVLVGKGNAAPGKVDINAQARIDLNAGRQTAQPLLDGVLIYRHAPNAQANQNGKGEIDINGGANVRLDGAIVAPTSWVTMGGNGATDPTSCNVFVVHSMEFRGNAHLSAAGCDFYGTRTTVPRMPRLVE